MENKTGKKVAIVGSRNYPNLQEVIDYVNSLPEDTVIVSGGARGVDSAAENAAKSRGLPDPIIFLPDWEIHGKAAGPIRNREIVKAADEVVAFSYQNSKGTANSISEAIKLGKKVTIFEGK